MSVYTIVPNQPLGWSETIPTDECGCEKHEYCAPLLFEFTNAVYEAYTARAIADGALPSDRTEACMEEVMDTFYELSRSVRFISDPISVLYQGDPSEEETCSNMPFILDSSPSIEGDLTTIIGSEDPGYIEGQLSFVTEVGEFEVSEQFIEVFFESPFTGGCKNTVCFSVEPDDRVVDYPWQIVVKNGNGAFEINSNPLNAAAPFSICFEMDLYDPVVGVINISMPLGSGGEIFQGIFRIASATENCNFAPLGLVESTTGEVIGEIYEQTTGTIVEGDEVSFFTEATIGVASIEEIKNKCFYIKVASECCCDDVFYSKCIKPLTDPCHTVAISFWQGVTVSVPAYGFGFYYPAASPGSEFKQFMRVWGEIRNPQYDGEMEMYQDSFGRRQVVYAESREFKSFIINYSPEYVHNALRLACRHDNFELTDVSYNIIAQNSFTRSEAYSPSWIRISRLAPVTLEVEKKTQNLIGGSSKTFCS